MKFKADAEPGKLTITNAGPGEIAVGNAKGGSLLVRLAPVERRVGGFETEVVELRNDNAGLRKENAERKTLSSTFGSKSPI